jgi:hypothetical protein
MPITAPTGMEDGLSEFVTPVRKIYDGYQKIMETKRRGDTPLGKQLHTKFGIEQWEWTRLKVIYELALAGNEHATGLVKQIDAKKITVSAAYGELSRTLKDQAASVHLPKHVKLRDVYDYALRSKAFAETTAQSLRLGVPVNTYAMNPDDISDCLVQLRAASKYFKTMADHISRSVGGT